MTNISTASIAGLFLMIIPLTSVTTSAPPSKDSDKSEFTYVDKAEWMALSKQATTGLKVSSQLLLAICKTESDWIGRPGAAGERGVCQIKPETAMMLCRSGCYPEMGRPQRLAQLARDLEDPKTNLTYAARYLAWLQERLGSDDETLLTIAYNGGLGHPSVRYARKVKKNLDHYAQMDQSR